MKNTSKTCFIQAAWSRLPGVAQRPPLIPTRRTGDHVAPALPVRSLRTVFYAMLACFLFVFCYPLFHKEHAPRVCVCVVKLVSTLFTIWPFFPFFFFFFFLATVCSTAALARGCAEKARTAMLETPSVLLPPCLSMFSL